jgi:hypothetical protein
MADDKAKADGIYAEFVQVRTKVLELRAENLALSRELVARTKAFRDLKERLRQSRG